MKGINVFRALNDEEKRQVAAGELTYDQYLAKHNKEKETIDVEVLPPSSDNVSNHNDLPTVSQHHHNVARDQHFALTPANQNIDYSDDNRPINSYVQAYDYGVSIQQISAVGFNLDAARDLNKQMLSNTLNLQKKYYDNLEAERHAEALQQINLNQKFALSVQNIVKDDDGNFIKPPKIDWRTMIASFIFKNMLVFERINGLKIIWKKDSENNRHIAIDDDELKMNFIEFVEDQCENFYASEAELNRAFKTLKYKIPPLKKSDLTILAETQLPFANGYLDIKSGKFTAMTPDDRHFNQFAMPYDYNPLAKNPDAFDEMLADMFANDEAKIHLAYQLIGAIISSVSTLKRIYVFQGVSHGGKTRLANIIISLIGEDEVHSSNNVSEITDKDFSKKAHNKRLAYIKDCSKRVLGDSQAANLKSYADGGHLKNSARFKILICTNHKITSGENDYLETALRNRFVILPFARAMDNTSESVTNFEDYYFPQERDGIVNKALAAFQEVLQSGGRFSQDYPINEVVEANSEIEMPVDEEIYEIQQEVANVNIKKADDSYDRIKKVIDEKFVFTDECKMTAKEVFWCLNCCLPNDVKDPASLGRKLAKIFGDTLKNDRTSEDTLYNLAFKETFSE